LRVETDRWLRPKPPREQRLCRHCSMHAVEDEQHFLFDCPFYSITRGQHFSLFGPNYQQRDLRLFEQQLEQQRDITVKLQDRMEVLAFQMNKMGTVNRGQLGCTMALLQQTARGSKLGGGSTAQYVQASDTSNDEKLTAAARQRRKAEKRSHELLMAAKQKELRLQNRQMQATHPGPPSSGSGGAAEQSDLQAPSSPPAQQPSVGQEDIDTLPEQAAEHSHSARAGAPDQGAGAGTGTSRLSNLPVDMYPASVKELMVPVRGRDDPVWTSWLGEYLTLNGKNHWLCYVLLGLNCQHMSRVLQCCHNEV